MKKIIPALKLKEGQKGILMVTEKDMDCYIGDEVERKGDDLFHKGSLPFRGFFSPGSGFKSDEYGVAIDVSPIPENDVVNHPSHYTQHPSGIECIEITKHMNFCIGSAMGYLWRAGLKDDCLENLEKAKKYIDFEIERIKEERE